MELLTVMIKYHEATSAEIKGCLRSLAEPFDVRNYLVSETVSKSEELRRIASTFKRILNAFRSEYEGFDRTFPT